MLDVEFELKGVDEIAKTFRRLDANIQQRFIRKALKEISAEVATELKARAPSSKGTSFSEKKYHKDLKNSISGSDSRKRKGYISVLIRMAFWWRFVEFGTKKRQTESGFNRGALINIRPFVDPVLQDQVPGILSKFMNSIADQINRMK